MEIFGLLFLLGSAAVSAQSGMGARFGSRDPQTCPSRKAPAGGGLSAAQAKQYLVSDVTIQVERPRPFNIVTDTFAAAKDNAVRRTECIRREKLRQVAGDWHCTMTGSALGSRQVNGFPPPGK
jgi:hypothetical protein